MDPRTGNLSQPAAKVTETTKTETWIDNETGEVRSSVFGVGGVCQAYPT
ncbi:hypothetical protein [Parenemella sanctibonifatiensis]|nr:hypothetical protein [Parenemella sanctibonifatiensis]